MFDVFHERRAADCRPMAVPVVAKHDRSFGHSWPVRLQPKPFNLDAGSRRSADQGTRSQFSSRVCELPVSRRGNG